jgi:hypothetical protein
VYRRLGGTRGPDKSRALYYFLLEEEMKIINWEQDFFVHHKIKSAVKRLEFVSVRCYI